MPISSASAPGKVLICGGYLIVEAPNVGLSLGVTARFTSSVIAAEDAADGVTSIEVRSPQFGATFNFTVTFADELVSVQQTAGRESPFLFYSVLTTMSYLRHFSSSFAPKKLVVVLEADNDFYSQRNFLEAQGKSVTAANLRTVPPHNALVGEVSKTGLGSSAALTTSLVACLCNYYAHHVIKNDAATIVSTELIHRVAQAAHSVAQGKIGSGFDVHTAVYGTNVYVRFPPSRVDVLMADKLPQSFNHVKVWDCVKLEVEWVPPRPVQLDGLPRGVNLMLADIHQGGSATPGMVSKIMGWRKSVAGTPDNAWDRLSQANIDFLSALKLLWTASEERVKAYDETIETLRLHPSASWAALAGAGGVASLFEAFRARANESRTLLRSIGEVSEVEVEPKVLTPLLDATLALPGVVAAGCPGAGGYDAIFAIVVGGAEEMARVEAYWESSPLGLHVCPLLVREESRGLTLTNSHE